MYSETAPTSYFLPEKGVPFFHEQLFNSIYRTLTKFAGCLKGKRTIQVIQGDQKL